MFFALYYRNFVFQRSIVWQSKAFFIGMLTSVAAILAQAVLPETESAFQRAFLNAALVEECVRFAAIYLRIRNSSASFTITEGIFDGILIALGFSFSENLHYSVVSSGYVILLRCVSSVPLHVFCGAVMAFFLSYRNLCAENRVVWRRINWFGLRRFELAVLALAVPVLIHGVFDYALFRGEQWNFLIVPVLMTGLLLTEYVAARGMIVFGKNILDALGLDADDMEIIARQQEYEKWLNDFQDEAREPVQIFVNHWDRVPTVAAVLFLMVSAAFIFVLSAAPSWAAEIGIERYAAIALTILLPASFAAILLLRDKINYLYFRETMLRVPSGTLVKISTHHGAQELETMVFDVMPRGLFLTGIETLHPGQRVTLAIHRPKKEPVIVRSAVRWVNKHNRQLPSGALVQFLRPAPGFLWFLLVHSLRHIHLRPVTRPSRT